MKKHLALAFALAASTLGLSLPASAATKVQCENIARPAGYLTTEVNILDGSCLTGRAIRYSTPSNGLTIIRPAELPTISPAYVITTVNKFGNASTFRITLLGDRLIACTMPTIVQYDYFTIPYQNIPNCRYNEPITQANSVTYHQYMFVEFARPAGKPGNLRVSLNSQYRGSGLNYVIRVTSRLNGGARTVMKTGFVKSGSYQLKDLVPDMVSDAASGANFTFEVELFVGVQTVSKYSIQATGQELIMN